MSTSATILLIDDEEMILEVTQAMLEQLGYTVLTAPGGTAGLELLAQHKEDIDLIILDMMMPDMDGSKAFDLIQEQTTDIPVLLSSGYSLNADTERILEKGGRAFMQKPFSMAKLTETIETTLGQA